MAKKDNRTTGNRFEQDFAKVLSAHRFWAHVMQQNKAGQPADIIAVKGKFHTLIDCKVCENGVFPFSRVEENQRLAMKTFTKKANDLCYFALKVISEDGKEQVRMISLGRIETLENRGYKQLTHRTMDTETWPLESWLESTDTWAEDT